jgi:hypothetical protein
MEETMCHSILMGLILGFLASRVFIGLRRLRAMRYGQDLGCGGWHRHAMRGGPFHRYWQHGRHGEPGPGAAFFSRFMAPGLGKSIEELAGALDLNARQQQEAAPALTRLREYLGERGPHMEAALSAVAGERFDRQRLQDLLAHPSLVVPPEVTRELLDGLEHLHNILIPEQREALRDQLSKPARS